MELVVIRVPETEEEFYRAMAEGPCLCKEIDPSDKPCLTCAAREALQLFWCPRCERLVPWEQGALDETPALCDDCAVVIQALWDLQPSESKGES